MLSTTDTFTILEHQIPKVNELYAVRKCRLTDFVALKLPHVKSRFRMPSNISSLFRWKLYVHVIFTDDKEAAASLKYSEKYIRFDSSNKVGNPSRNMSHTSFINLSMFCLFPLQCNIYFFTQIIKICFTSATQFLQTSAPSAIFRIKSLVAISYTA